MDSLFFILFIIGIIYLMVWVIKLIIRSAINAPTWTGIIISAIVGMLPLYLILCFFGIMGEKRDQSSNGTQSPIGNYAEELSRRYAYEKSSIKNKNWINYAVLAFVVVFLFFIFKANKSEEQGTTIPVETFVSENEALEEPKEETSQIPSEIEIPHKENVDGKTDKKQKSTLELLEERNHASVVKQAKEAGVSTEGSTLDILERINHASVVKQAKEAGVSTEGSTLDILERINHANVVKQAKEAGVSTEGSTLDILERINHANVVKQAKEAGVSTAGSTLDILERINRKALEDYLK